MAKSGMAMLSARADRLVNPGWRSSFGPDGSIPLWLSSSARRSSLIYEDLVEGLPDELFNIRFRETELRYRNLAAALAQLRNVGLSRNRMLKTECSRRSIA